MPNALSLRGGMLGSVLRREAVEMPEEVAFRQRRKRFAG